MWDWGGEVAVEPRGSSAGVVGPGAGPGERGKLRIQGVHPENPKEKGF